MKHEPTQSGFNYDRYSETKSLGIEIEKLISRADPDGKRATTSSVITKTWKALVGNTAADNTHSVHLRGSELIVGVSSPIWATELSLFSDTYCEKLNAALGQKAVTSIRYKVTKKPE
jgi:predicted nucleic acid-binding Zn ribbon protein